MTVDRQFKEARRRFIGAETPDEIYQALVSSTYEFLDCADCRIAIADGDVLIPQASATDTVDPEQTVPLSYGIAGQVYSNQESGIVNDITFTRSAASESSRRPEQSVLCIPLGDFGVFQAIADERAAFTETHRVRIEHLIEDALIALDRIHATSLPDGGSSLNFEQILTHELRTPITVATGRLEMAQNECESEHLRHLEKSLTRADEILSGVDTLAKVARLADRKVPSDKLTDVDIKKKAREAWAVIGSSEATLDIDGSCRVLAHPQYLPHVFENIFRNAITHAGPETTVRMGLLDAMSGWYIADDGPGIPASDRDSIFEPGYSPGNFGSGFGLTIVSNIVEAHDWEITVMDSQTGGARFEISNVEYV